MADVNTETAAVMLFKMDKDENISFSWGGDEENLPKLINGVYKFIKKGSGK